MSHNNYNYSYPAIDNNIPLSPLLQDRPDLLSNHNHNHQLTHLPYDPDADDTRSDRGDEQDDDDDDNVQIGEATDHHVPHNPHLPSQLSQQQTANALALSPSLMADHPLRRSGSRKSADDSLTDDNNSTYSADSTSLRDRDTAAHPTPPPSTPPPVPPHAHHYAYPQSSNHSAPGGAGSGQTLGQGQQGYTPVPAARTSSGQGGYGYGGYSSNQPTQPWTPTSSTPPSDWPKHGPSTPPTSSQSHYSPSSGPSSAAYPSTPPYPGTVPGRTTSRTPTASLTPSKPPPSSTYGSVFSLSRFREMLVADLGDRDDVRGWVPRVAGWDDEVWAVAPGSVWLSAPHLVDGLAGGLPADAWDPVEDDTPDVLIPESDKGAVMSMVTRTQSKRCFEVWNLYDTEINYVKDLDTLLTVFRPRMQAMREAVSEHAVKIVFAGVEELQKLHAKFLADLDRMCRVWDDDTSPLGKLFLDYTDDWDQGYRIFIENFGTTLKEIQALEKNAEFRQFLQDTEQSPETKRQNLKSYLLFPVQRVMRYQLLLQSIIKHSPEEHPDLENLRKARELMLSFANKVNERKKQAEETAGLFRAHEATDGCPPTIISSHRRLVTEAEVVDQGSKKELHLFLFSDMLMIARLRKAGTTTIMGISFTRDEERDTADGKPYKFVRFLDFRDIALEVREKCPVNVLRINLNFRKGDHRTETTFETGVTPEKESKIFNFIFAGDKQEAEKSRNQFHMAVENEMKRAVKS
ncbi:Dbl homology domain-containing protein [Gonapodya prolifera JEL478]|uniref:Dbl homology domain-containing protein n=1 Tax=Gonapodya prolifera (strain JEL478) TaxID=1344416 RepID=A0A139ANP7_GONPJ|nr:Dbl homology domain-containing protein [Gonapodya prolifera JEL478]|eukprot:KXS18123.1 Dbl homology domain-containing protein [Gonapodya prolifera JEL478]